ncbi:AMP-binding protein [Nocardia sp. NPDC005745]|uniref:AMP-binding protein n=1 Tax=Nocardia sp. NPDC005745 TaxID=3157061 RepID=UPI0033DE68FF
MSTAERRTEGAPAPSREPRLDAPIGSHFADVLEAIAASRPDRAALVSGDCVRTWGEFDDRASRLARQLQDARLSRHGSVGICLRNSNEYLETYLAALKIRGVPTSINYRYAEDELVSLLRGSACEALVFGAAFADRVLAVRDRVPSLSLLLMVQDGTDDGTSPVPDGVLDYESVMAAAAPAPPVKRSGDDPLVVYTGGTTGLPKALTYPIRSRLRGRVAEFARLVGLPDPGTAGFVEAAAALAERGASPVGLPASPLMHNAALVTCALPTLLLGGTVVTVPSAAFDPDEVWDVVDRRDVTSMTIVGDAMGRPLLQALDDRVRRGRTSAANLRTVTSTGMAWNSTTKAGLLAHLPHLQLVEVFGATEGLMGTSRWTAETPVHSNPRFTPVAGLRILREDASDAAPGETGLIAFPVADAVYYRGDPEKTAETFRILDGQRYAVLGDLGRLLPDGSLEPLGRGGQVVNTGGEKVFPAEVEDVVRGLDGVTDCLVVGVTDPRWGQRVVAVVSRTAESLTAQAVRAAVRSRLAGFKVPKDVLFVPTVPRFPNGKADLQEAARIAEAAVGSDARET